MSTYAMCDIHGCFDDFQRMLEKIHFSADDHMILAGDLIERGPQNLEMLRWLESGPENMMLLRGNHEEEFAMNVDLMGKECSDMGGDPESFEDTKKAFQKMTDKTLYFDYYGSIRELLEEHHVTLADLTGWAALFRRWPCRYRTTINGRVFVVVHAGYVEDIDELPDWEFYKKPSDFYLYAREDAYMFGGIEHGVVIAGHTPTIIPSSFVYNHGEVFRYYNEEKDCVYYDIDCGAVFRYVGEPEAKLACIRLDDESITYV